ncbi:hypothetical protein BDP27DRAFT_1378512 [Rhodocollybia butyracea]|uniref:Uncharacterized protein n=1 Tax=Rhodocollybia butyracea TaxID=206335 RepID=A0A9P5P434_9AGAR|nr:hypothetical protein BDP27DRAFT_1378512 [Rhodocollybia butyracea]
MATIHLHMDTPGAFTVAPENQMCLYHLSRHLGAHLEIGVPLVIPLNSNLATKIDGSQQVSAILASEEIAHPTPKVRHAGGQTKGCLTQMGGYRTPESTPQGLLFLSVIPVFLTYFGPWGFRTPIAAC